MSLDASGPRPPKHADFLASEVLVSLPVMRLLRVGADLLGYPSPNHLANHLLLGALEAYPQVQRLEAELSRVTQRAREELMSAQKHPNP